MSERDRDEERRKRWRERKKHKFNKSEPLDYFYQRPR